MIPLVRRALSSIPGAIEAACGVLEPLLTERRSKAQPLGNAHVAAATEAAAAKEANQENVHNSEGNIGAPWIDHLCKVWCPHLIECYAAIKGCTYFDMC